MDCKLIHQQLMYVVEICMHFTNAHIKLKQSISTHQKKRHQSRFIMT